MLHFCSRLPKIRAKKNDTGNTPHVEHIPEHLLPLLQDIDPNLNNNQRAALAET